MELALSSAAAPDLPLDDLLAACQRRGLSGLELAAGDAHGVSPALPAAALDAVRARAAEAGVRLLGYRVGRLEEAGDPLALRLSATLGIPVLLPCGALLATGMHALAERYAATGATLLLAHRTWMQEAASARGFVHPARSGTVGLCWEVDPGAAVAEQAHPVLRAAGDSLKYVRLSGGGPEAVEQTGQGIGSLMARLALARYRGPVVLVPSTPRYRQAWRAWLGRRSGWGCGSRSADATLVVLNA
jgi:sugar phosphate isomerase/epimerase